MLFLSGTQERMKLGAYYRVSSDEQEANGLSLEVQEQQVRAWAQAYGHDLVVEVKEAKSAKNLNREGLRRLIQAQVNHDIQGIVVSRLDRLTRSLKDLMYLLEQYYGQEVKARTHERFHKYLFSVQEGLNTTQPMGQMMASMMIMIAQWERERLLQRTMEGTIAKTRKTKRMPRSFCCLYGFEKSQTGKVRLSPKRWPWRCLTHEMRQFGFLIFQIDEAFVRWRFSKAFPSKNRIESWYEPVMYHPGLTRALLYLEATNQDPAQWSWSRELQVGQLPKEYKKWNGTHLAGAPAGWKNRHLLRCDVRRQLEAEFEAKKKVRAQKVQEHNRQVDIAIDNWILDWIRSRPAETPEGTMLRKSGIWERACQGKKPKQRKGR